MLHHRTTNPAIKAKTIAHREALGVWYATGDLNKYNEIFTKTYDQVLTELHSHEPVEEEECFQ